MNQIEEETGICPNCGRNFGEGIPPHHLQPGVQLKSRYLIGNAIGEGGFGITYIGRDLLFDNKIAIKEYYPSGCANRSNLAGANVTSGTREDIIESFENGKRKFLNEAKILAKFSNEKGIVSVKDFFEENNTAYIVMEYLEGKTLSAFIKEKGRISPEETVSILKPVIESLKKIHLQGLIHRDISPDNIMLQKDGTVKLLDFGAARTLTPSGQANKSLSVLLKPGYAPEEQYRRRGQQGPWTDIYALCATMYKCITGTTPDDATERMYNDELEAPSEMGIAIDSDTEKAILKGMSVFGKDRYQSIEELMADLYKEGRITSAFSSNNKAGQTASAAGFVTDEYPVEDPHTVLLEEQPNPVLEEDPHTVLLEEQPQPVQMEEDPHTVLLEESSPVQVDEDPHTVLLEENSNPNQNEGEYNKALDMYAHNQEPMDRFSKSDADGKIVTTVNTSDRYQVIKERQRKKKKKVIKGILISTGILLILAAALVVVISYHNGYIPGKYAYSKYLSTPLGSEVTIDTYVQAKLPWNKGAKTASLYCQDKDGGCFVYVTNCDYSQYSKLTEGTKIRVTGLKTFFDGRLRITNASFLILEGNYLATAYDAGSIIADQTELKKHQNELLELTNLKLQVAKYVDSNPVPYIYTNEDNDLFVRIYQRFDGRSTSQMFECVAYADYDLSVYKATESLDCDDVFDLQGYFLPDEGILWITKVTVH